MKITRVMVIIFCLLSIFAVPAQASGNTVAFIPLLTRVDPNIPIPIQTRQALRPLMPQLVAAQQSGSILEFRASLSTGVLKVVYSGSEVNSGPISGKQVFTDMEEAVASMQLPQLPAAASDAPTVSAGGLGVFEMRLFDNCFQARNLVPNARLVGNLRDKTGRILALYDSIADASGNISFGCFSWAGSYADVVPGHKLTFKEIDGTTLLKTYTVLVPNLTFNRIDKLNSVVRAYRKEFRAFWYHGLWDAAGF
jgi:hypothetical protein